MSILKISPLTLLRILLRIAYILGLIIAIFFFIRLWPESVVAISWVLLLLIMGMVIIPILRRNIFSYQQGIITRSRFVLVTVVELAGVLVTAIAAIFLAGVSARYVGQSVGTAVETSAPGMGSTAGTFAGVAAAVLVGIAAGYFIAAIWSRLTKVLLSAAFKG
jgi:hypothetical protein